MDTCIKAIVLGFLECSWAVVIDKLSISKKHFAHIKTFTKVIFADTFVQPFFK